MFVASDAACSDASVSEYDEPTVVDFDIAGLQLMFYIISPLLILMIDCVKFLLGTIALHDVKSLF